MPVVWVPSCCSPIADTRELSAGPIGRVHAQSTMFWLGLKMAGISMVVDNVAHQPSLMNQRPFLFLCFNADVTSFSERAPKRLISYLALCACFEFPHGF